LAARAVCTGSGAGKAPRAPYATLDAGQSSLRKPRAKIRHMENP